MAISRRQFLQRSGLSAAGAVLGPGLLQVPFARRALGAQLNDRYFISLFMSGGNDGLNTVVPLSDGAQGTLRTYYTGYRDTLALSTADLGPMQIDNDPATDSELALHPALDGFKQIYDAGDLAVIQGCGYPEANLSHDTSKNKWMTATPLGPIGSEGWVGRYMAANYGSDDIPAVQTSSNIGGELRTTATNVLGISRLDRFDFPRDRFERDDDPAKDIAFQALYDEAISSSGTLASRLGTIGRKTFDATQLYPELYEDFETAYPDELALFNTDSTGTKRNMRDIAAYILGTESGKIDSRIFRLAVGGFDTHNNQGGTEGTHFNKLALIDDAFKIFYDTMSTMGIAHKVCILVWSEFGRRIPENANNGTDHGTQAPMFIIGGGVNGGVYGNHPDIFEDNLTKAGNTIYNQIATDPYRATDFRDVYGTVIKHWFDTDPSGLLPPDDAGLDPDYYWLTPNFDMGFV